MPDTDIALTTIDADPSQLVSASDPVDFPSLPTYHLVARNPQQMAAAQSELTTWLKAKRDSTLHDVHELETARDEAKRHKWKTSAFTSAISKFRKQHDFYQKILEAVLAGYTLIPNFPIDVFAIRVTRTYSPTEDQAGPLNGRADYLAEQPDVLSVGVGDYKSPKPEGYHTYKAEKQGDKMVNRDYFHSTSMADPEFPFAVARPEIMSATAEAMALRVFDQIGICHQAAGQNRRARGKGDPLIIGQVIMSAEKYGWIRKPVSFLIAWHLDLRTL